MLLQDHREKIRPVGERGSRVGQQTATAVLGAWPVVGDNALSAKAIALGRDLDTTGTAVRSVVVEATATQARKSPRFSCFLLHAKVVLTLQMQGAVL